MNSLCERLIGTLRREYLDWIIPLTEEHLRKTLLSWVRHYNRGRPHSSLGPGLPDPPLNFPVHLQRRRHSFDRSARVVGAHSALNGLHHEYAHLGPRCMTVVEFLRTTVTKAAVSRGPGSLLLAWIRF